MWALKLQTIYTISCPLIVGYALEMKTKILLREAIERQEKKYISIIDINMDFYIEMYRDSVGLSFIVCERAVGAFFFTSPNWGQIKIQYETKKRTKQKKIRAEIHSVWFVPPVTFQSVVFWTRCTWRISSMLLLLKLECGIKKKKEEISKRKKKPYDAGRHGKAKWENLSLKYCVSIDKRKRSITTGAVILIYWLSSPPQKYSRK